MSDEDGADLSAPRRTRIGVFLLVALLHVAAVLVLIRAFAPQLAHEAVEAVVSTFSVTVTTPPPEPARQDKAAGGAGAAGKQALARPESAPRPRIPVAAHPAPQAASSGAADTSGAKESGTGTGAGGVGSGTGSGAGGSGQGGGLARKAEKIAGDIAEKDYDKANRALRLGQSVIIAINVNAEGRPTGCRVVRAGPDPAADALTCRLAVERFRFHPATDAQGNPVPSIFGWQQRWFY